MSRGDGGRRLGKGRAMRFETYVQDVLRARRKYANLKKAARCIRTNRLLACRRRRRKHLILLRRKDVDGCNVGLRRAVLARLGVRDVYTLAWEALHHDVAALLDRADLDGLATLGTCNKEGVATALWDGEGRGGSRCTRKSTRTGIRALELLIVGHLRRS